MRRVPQEIDRITKERNRLEREARLAAARF